MGNAGYGNHTEDTKQDVESKRLDPQGERARFLGAVSAFLDRAAIMRPRVIVIDGLHLADELSEVLAKVRAACLASRSLTAACPRRAP